MNANGAAKPDIEGSVAGWIGALELGPAAQAGPLQFIPVLWSGALGAVDILAHQAIADGGLEVLEKDGGVVQELLAFNKGPRPVLIVEGETLIGARQNRMVAHTVVVGPGMRVVVPVGCMEHGRWQSGKSRFGAGIGYSKWYMRRDAKRDVIAARSKGLAPSLVQGRLWSQVDDELRLEGLTSMTADYNAVMEARLGEAAARVEAIHPLPTQVGVMALRDGALIAVEVVGHPQTWAEMSARVLTSIAPAAVDEPSHGRRRDRRGWMEAIGRAARRLTIRPAVGLGSDVEIQGSTLVGSGVWMGDRFAHLSVYAAA